MFITVCYRPWQGSRRKWILGLRVSKAQFLFNLTILTNAPFGIFAFQPLFGGLRILGVLHLVDIESNYFLPAEDAA